MWIVLLIGYVIPNLDLHEAKNYFLYKKKRADLDLQFLARALNPPILGPKLGPIPNAKKHVFFPIQQKNSQFDKKKIFFFGSPSMF